MLRVFLLCRETDVGNIWIILVLSLLFFREVTFWKLCIFEIENLMEVKLVQFTNTETYEICSFVKLSRTPSVV